MRIKIALAGNPNCGKTTMFNDLTGSTQYVGNWPGVTVERKANCAAKRISSSRTCPASTRFLRTRWRKSSHATISSMKSRMQSSTSWMAPTSNATCT